MPEDKIIVMDTDFLSSFLKIGRLDLVRNFFNVKSLYIPVSVLKEILTTSLMEEFLKTDYIKIVKVHEEDFRMLAGEEFERLGSGEKDCMAFCKQHQASLLLMNDNKAGKVAGKNGISVLNISAFLFACKTVMFLDNNEIALIMKELKQKDHYEFSDDEKKKLLAGI